MGDLSYTTAVTSGVAETNGADLYFERRGEGPPLLMIAGAGGDCSCYSSVADLLASYCTVLTYDRRGNSRSQLHHDPTDMSMVEQSADAIAILRASGFESALVFGNSGGATIALDLAAHHPEAVDAAVVHEPPLPGVLPDAAAYLTAHDQIIRLLETEGWEAAFRLFQVRFGRVPPGQLSMMMAVLLEPAMVLPPGPHRDLMQRMSGNWEHLIRFELQSFVHYVPDLDQIAAHGVRIALAAGVDTIAAADRGDQPHDALHRPSVLIADRLGAEFAEFPGGHMAPMDLPGPFATALLDLLRRL